MGEAKRRRLKGEMPDQGGIPTGIRNISLKQQRKDSLRETNALIQSVVASVLVKHIFEGGVDSAKGI